jgi:hypothetical protein
MNLERPANRSDALESRVAAWLEAEARFEAPDWLLSAVLEQTRGTPQVRGLWARLLRLVSALAIPRPFTAGRWHRSGALAASLLIVLAVGIGALLGSRLGIRPEPSPIPASPAAQSSGLLILTLDADALPAELAGILFFRKEYPTDREIAYGRGFVPPNTFVRYVESGELAIRPRSKVRILRAGSSWDDAEVIVYGQEAVVGPGDAFVMEDPPWSVYGSEALGEMSTPGADASVVGFAIRESSRCCAMSHQGMRSPWSHTLRQGVDALRGAPVTLRITRWVLPTGASLPAAEAGVLTLRVVDAGRINGTVVPAASPDPAAAAGAAISAAPAAPLSFPAGMPLQPPLTVRDGDSVRYENVDAETAVVYQLTVEAAGEPGTADEPGADPVTVTTLEPLSRPRAGHAATELADGRVLVTGGGHADAEVYSPTTETIETAGGQSAIRAASAVLLQDGRVLLVGGGSEADIYEPPEHAVVPLGPTIAERHFQSATRLWDGRVLVTGGETATAEVYDPETGSFAPTGPMITSRSRHSSTLLRDRRVLVAGGGLPVIELYDPESGTFSASRAPGLQPFDRGTATRLSDARVLLIGHGAPPQLYDPGNDTVTLTGPMVVPRYEHAAVLLDDGRVLIAGGLDLATLAPTASLEIFDPLTDTFEEVGSLGTARTRLAATPLCGRGVLITGGSTSTSAVAAVELVDVPLRIPPARPLPTAAPLPTSTACPSPSP